MKYFLFALFITTAPAMACEADTDCLPGSQCLKAAGGLYGVCAGGLSPGNSNDRQPGYTPTDVNRTYGNACSLDIDCSPGSHCFKVDSSDGLCMK